jgi:fermentation-respiration switch protein FrsA (DUF1100 family)
MSIEKRDVMFKRGETFTAAGLFLPATAEPSARVPAVAMAYGLGGVKEMYLEPFARRFAEAGIAALVFDYRGFGVSGGEPRQRISPHDQMEDYRNALTWLSLQSEIDADRLGGVGRQLQRRARHTGCRPRLSSQDRGQPGRRDGYRSDPPYGRRP